MRINRIISGIMFLVSMPLLVISCSSGGGGGESNSWNLAGTWNSTMNYIENDGMWPYMLRASTWQITQSGNNITVNDDYLVWTGTIDGDRLSLSYEFDNGGSLACPIRGTANLTIESNNRMSGTGEDREHSDCGSDFATFNLLVTR